MTFDQLRSDLADLAQEVSIVDLRDRSIATSRRTAIRRAVGASVAAVALIATAAVGIMLRGTQNGALPPANPTPTVATSPTPSVTAAPSAAPVGTTVDGTAYYFATTSAGFRVYSMTGGKASRHYDVRVSNDAKCVPNSLIVSPDGRWLAWVEDSTQTGDIFGTLSLARIDGTGRRKIDNVVCNFNELSWTVDSKRLLIHRNVQNRGLTQLVDPASGKLDPAPEEPVGETQSVWSTNRAYRAFRPIEGGVPTALVIEDSGGRLVRRVDYSRDDDSFTTCGYTVKGISDDGRYVSIGGCATDPSRIMYGQFVFDTTTGRHVTFSIDHAQVVGFLPGGRVLLRERSQTTGALAVATLSGQVLARSVEPAELAGAVLVGYRP
jgi:hypothetical protein